MHPLLALQVIDELINKLRGALNDLPAGSKVGLKHVFVVPPKLVCRRRRSAEPA